MSSLELSKAFELKQKTCWEFKWKIQQAMQSSKQYKLTGDVHVDEFFIGGSEEQKRGRGKGKKRLVGIAMEKVKDVGMWETPSVFHISTSNRYLRQLPYIVTTLFSITL